VNSFANKSVKNNNKQSNINKHKQTKQTKTNITLECFALFATHYHELTELEKEINYVKNLNVAATVENGELVLLHK